MTVQNWKSIGLAIAICCVLSPLTRAADGQPDRETLSQMGLGSLVVMSDDEALSVRGQGYKHGSSSSVLVFGNSSASFDAANGGAQTENGYLVSGKHKAAGGNYSEAGVSLSVSKGKPGGGHGHNGGGFSGTKTTTVTLKYFAGGYSWGKAY